MIQRDEYRRHLPHIVPLSGCYHVTFRVKGSIPTEKVIQLSKDFIEKKINFQSNLFNPREQATILNELYREYYEQFETELHKNREDQLSNPVNANIVKEALHHFDRQRYQLVSYAIMPNHVHVIFLNISVPLPSIMKSIKGFTAYRINQIEDQSKKVDRTFLPDEIMSDRNVRPTRTFWQDESYDHMIRSRNELSDAIDYVLFNPVKSGICMHFSQHPFTYVAPNFYPE